MNDTQISFQGNVGGNVTVRQAGDAPVATFRVATTPRHFQRSTGTWIDGDTQWYTVHAWRTLAANCEVSLRRGDPVVELLGGLESAHGRESVSPAEGWRHTTCAAWGWRHTTCAAPHSLSPAARVAGGLSSAAMVGGGLTRRRAGSPSGSSRRGPRPSRRARSGRRRGQLRRRGRAARASPRRRCAASRGAGARR